MPFEFDDARLLDICPPDHFIAAPGGDKYNFLPIGKYYVELWWDAGYIKPNSTVLDIGCSVGRMAIPMTQVLEEGKGRYEGFDIVNAHTAWCSMRLTPLFPHFRFIWIGARSTYYPGGSEKTEGVEFPYESDTFDFTWATSVFTHMGNSLAFERYMQEIARVLKPGGRAFLTFFLKDNENDKSCHHFPWPMPHIFKEAHPLYVADVRNSDAVSSYRIDYVRHVGEHFGLDLVSHINGNWGPGIVQEPYQDLLTFQKV